MGVGTTENQGIRVWDLMEMKRMGVDITENLDIKVGDLMEMMKNGLVDITESRDTTIDLREELPDVPATMMIGRVATRGPLWNEKIGSIFLFFVLLHLKT